jgi:hypothetical protein
MVQMPHFTVFLGFLPITCVPARNVTKLCSQLARAPALGWASSVNFIIGRVPDHQRSQKREKQVQLLQGRY